jgi:hypothetical protein
VQTIEFTVADKNSELPAPMSVQEMESMTLAQKKMAAMIMESTAEDVEAHRAQQAAAEAEAAAAVGQAGVSNVNEDEAAMEESDEEDEEMQEKRRREEEERRREIERAQVLQASSVNPVGPMKIRTDYVPKRELPPFCTRSRTYEALQLVKRKINLQSRPAQSVGNKSRWTSFRSICASSCLTPSGSHNVMH